jgi:hypothetical protein
MMVLMTDIDEELVEDNGGDDRSGGDDGGGEFPESEIKACLTSV